MAILEAAISFQSESLIERQFYSNENVLDKNLRHNLLQAISGVVNEAFGETVQSFSLGNYAIVMISHDLEVPSALLGQSGDALVVHPDPLIMYCIVDKNTDEKTIQKTMAEALSLFVNRYSSLDILKKKKKAFKDFNKRIDAILGDLILKSEDRFKSLF